MTITPIKNEYPNRITMASGREGFMLFAFLDELLKHLSSLVFLVQRDKFDDGFYNEVDSNDLNDC